MTPPTRNTEAELRVIVLEVGIRENGMDVLKMGAFLMFRGTSRCKYLLKVEFHTTCRVRLAISVSVLCTVSSSAISEDCHRKNGMQRMGDSGDS